MRNKKIIKILIVVALVSGLIYFVFFYLFHDVNKQKNFLREQIADLNKEVTVLEEENKSLQEGILEINQEEFLEKEARVNLGYKKEGEKTVILKINTTTTKSKEQLKKEASF
jgi:cell division protein FtsB